MVNGSMTVAERHLKKSGSLSTHPFPVKYTPLESESLRGRGIVNGSECVEAEQLSDVYSKCAVCL